MIKNIIREAIEEVVAYHGSNADFDDFDLAYINTGAKSQDYGYGVYLSMRPDATSTYGKNHYTVEISSDKKKYLYADKVYPKSILQRIKIKLYKYIMKHDDAYQGAEKDLAQDLNDAFHDMDGLGISATIESYIGSDKETSEFLYSMGFIGLKYNIGEYECVVMFNPKDVLMVDKKIGDN